MKWPLSFHRTLLLALLSLLVLWLLSILLVPFALPPNTVNFGEDGRSGIIEFEDERQAAGMTGYVWFVYWWGDANHHQKASRSYFLNGNQMPEDARDIGLYLGGIAGFALVLRRSVPFRGWWIVGGLMPIGLDGGIQLVTEYESRNDLRVLTGVIGGFVLALLLGFMILEMTRVPVPSTPPPDVPAQPAGPLTPDTPARGGGRRGAPSLAKRVAEVLRVRTPWDGAILTLAVVGSVVVILNIAYTMSG
jgi:uncharacterized membrane protein